jgi:hypothetical protein
MNKLNIKLLKDKNKKRFFNIIIYNKYNYKQYVLKNDLLYTFFVIIKFIYKFGFIK